MSSSDLNHTSEGSTFSAVQRREYRENKRRRGDRKPQRRQGRRRERGGLELRVVDGAETIRICLPLSATLGNLRRVVWEKTGVPWAEDHDVVVDAHERVAWSERAQKLLLHGRELEGDSATLVSLGVKDGDVIQLISMREVCLPRSFLEVAARNSVVEAVKRLIEEGEVWDFVSRQMVASAAVAAGREEILETLLGVGADEDGTAIEMASCPESIQILQAAGANPRNAFSMLNRSTADSEAAACCLLEGGCATHVLPRSGLYSQGILSSVGLTPQPRYMLRRDARSFYY